MCGLPAQDKATIGLEGFLLVAAKEVHLDADGAKPQHLAVPPPKLRQRQAGQNTPDDGSPVRACQSVRKRDNGAFPGGLHTYKN